MADFKIKFNQKKLNAPPVEEFSEVKLDKNTNAESSADDSFSSSSSYTSTSTNNDNTENKEKGGKRKSRRSRSPKVDYEKLESLVGQPRLEDKLAFQVVDLF